jgi:hypothetical protein
MLQTTDTHLQLGTTEPVDEHHLHHLATLRGLDDVRAGRVISQTEMRAWAHSLNTDNPLPPPFTR